MKPLLYIILIYFGSFTNLNAQADHSSEVYKTLKANDSLLFERGFNTCELIHFETFITNDFEFYHDIGGSQNSKEAFMQVVKNGICNPTNATTSRRELVEGSLEVFPLKSNGEIYGALQNGSHKFFETTNGIEVAGSLAKFSHLWILEDGKWYLRRVISFNHIMKK